MLALMHADIPALVMVLWIACTPGARLLKCVLSVPFASDIVNHVDDAGRSLLRFAFHNEAVDYIAVLLSVPGLAVGHDDVGCSLLAEFPYSQHHESVLLLGLTDQHEKLVAIYQGDIPRLCAIIAHTVFEGDLVELLSRVLGGLPFTAEIINHIDDDG